VVSQSDHPVYPKITVPVVLGYAKESGLSPIEANRVLVNRRREIINKERSNPMLYGWEPPIWRVCDSLLGMDWIIPERYGRDYGPRMRAALGFSEPVSVLLINGGNRAGKSEYMAKRALQCLLKFDQTNLWAFHTDSDMSRQYQQPLFWKYMPQQYKERAIMTATTYIAYKVKTGFSEGTFILPNLSNCDFRNYAQDKQKIEGGELGSLQTGGLRCVGFIADELIPEDWVETLILRLATRAASGVIGFTPVNGYTGTVKAFVDGAVPAAESTAFLLPKDGGEPDARCIEIEDCDAWIDVGVKSRDPGAREFEKVPRVLKCVDRNKAVVYFHSSDNPYGNPKKVMETLLSRDTSFKRERFYGVANKLVAGQFPLFNRDVHVVSPDRVPKDGTLYCIVDPCDGRNFFMLWILACPGDRAYVVHEWPNVWDPVPGQGVLGEWALPTGDSRLLDGRRGPAQNSLGWGLLQYKQEIARIEGWKAYDPAAAPDDIRAWDQYAEAHMRVFTRFLDARYGNTGALEADGVRTLFEEFDDIGLTFYETSSERRNTISEGVQMINAALYYDAEKPVVTAINCPRLFVSSRCENTIFALQTWTGRDGGKGATKDPVDCLRYFYLKACSHIAQRAPVASSHNAGGCY